MEAYDPESDDVGIVVKREPNYAQPSESDSLLTRAFAHGEGITNGVDAPTPLKIAVVVTGIAGSYLVNQLGWDHEVTGFERHQRKKFASMCPWATNKHAVAKFAQRCDVDLEDRILHEGRRMVTSVGGLEVESRLRGFVTFDKNGLTRDMLRGQKVRYGSWISDESDLKGYDLVVDATSLRVLLPKIESHELWMPSVQYLVEYERPPFDDFRVQVLDGLGGYLWYFPLGDGSASVGAGDVNKGHVKAIEAFFRLHGGKRGRPDGRAVRLCPPRYCQPFASGRVVGVGESIGAVFALLADGVVPALECSELLVENVRDLGGYRRKVLKKFAFYETAYDFFLPVFQGRIGLVEQASLSQSILSHVLADQSRYGVELQPTRMTIEPFELIKQALSFAKMLRT